jgi:hypothetical protein
MRGWTKQDFLTVICSTDAAGLRANLLPAIAVDNGVVRIASGVRAMKTIVSALVALSVLAGIAGSANAALDTKTFWEQQERQSY